METGWPNVSTRRVSGTMPVALALGVNALGVKVGDNTATGAPEPVAVPLAVTLNVCAVPPSTVALAGFVMMVGATAVFVTLTVQAVLVVEPAGLVAMRR